MSDAEMARSYWATREHKIFAIDLTAGPRKRPHFSARMYVRATTERKALDSARRNCVHRVAGLRYHARLAGPLELGAKEMAR